MYIAYVHAACTIVLDVKQPFPSLVQASRMVMATFDQLITAWFASQHPVMCKVSHWVMGLLPASVNLSSNTQWLEKQINSSKGVYGHSLIGFPLIVLTQGCSILCFSQNSARRVMYFFSRSKTKHSNKDKNLGKSYMQVIRTKGDWAALPF